MLASCAVRFATSTSIAGLLGIASRGWHLTRQESRTAMTYQGTSGVRCLQDVHKLGKSRQAGRQGGIHDGLTRFPKRSEEPLPFLLRVSERLNGFCFFRVLGDGPDGLLGHPRGLRILGRNRELLWSLHTSMWKKRESLTKLDSAGPGLRGFVAREVFDHLQTTLQSSSAPRPHGPTRRSSSSVLVSESGKQEQKQARGGTCRRGS